MDKKEFIAKGAPTGVATNPYQDNDSGYFTDQTHKKYKNRREFLERWLRISRQCFAFLFVWSCFWILLAYSFIGDGDMYQFYSSFISLIFALYSFLVLFGAYRNKKTWHLNHLSWLILVLVSILELIFLISLLINANNYSQTHTNYGTIRVEYYHTRWQVILLFFMGIIGIIAHLSCAVSAQRFSLAISDLQYFETLMFTFNKNTNLLS